MGHNPTVAELWIARDMADAESAPRTVPVLLVRA